MKFDTNRAALTGGLIWGFLMFFTTIQSVRTGYGRAFLRTLESIYPGYTVSANGSVVGLVWGFVEIYVLVHLILWVYKQVSK